MIRALLLVLYAISGAIALVYEIAWSRRLGLVFGSSHLATTTALIAFIGGLALGARAGSPRATRSPDPLRLYAILEVLIGLFGIASPWILDAVQAAYLATWPEASGAGIAFVFYRLVLVGATLVVPTALMGATVPAMTRAFSALGDPGAAAFGWPLGANTAGAAAGTFLAGFVLLPRLGLRATILSAGAANLAIGVVALFASRRLSPRAESRSIDAGAATSAAPAPAASPPGRAFAGILLGVAGVVGFAGLGLEIAWTRLLALVLGSTAYAFTLMLGTYLVGLAVGTFAGARLAAGARHPADRIAWILVLFAAATGAGLFAANDLPYWFLDLFRRLGGREGGVFLAQAAIAGALMLLPAAASGACLPLVMGALSGRPESHAATAGRLYAVNTAAGIGSVALVTFILVPMFSLRGTMIGIVALLSAVAASIALTRGAWRALPVVVVAAAVSIGCGAFAPAWRPSLFATAVYRYADRYRELSREEFESVRNPDNSPILFDEDGCVARVTVVGPRNDPALLLDGKGASAGGDVPTEILLAQLPILIQGSPRRVLVIGQGAGVTTRSVLLHDGIAEVVAIELERKVLQCAPLFRPPGESGEDPRLRLVENDGRNYLLATQTAFDVICSQPSNPWVSGAAPLFTAEAYRAGSRRLGDGGVFCQWLQTFEMSEENLKVLVRTFAAEFPHVAFFQSTVPGNVFLVGSAREIRIDRGRLGAIGAGYLGVEMRRARVEAPSHLLALFCFRDGDLRAFAGEGPHNTDDNALIEFALPFDLFTNRVREIHAGLDAASRGLNGLVAFPANADPRSIAADWADWSVALQSARRWSLAREAAAEAARPR